MPTRKHLAVALLASLAGCGWNNLPQQDTYYLGGDLWDPNGVVPTEDGLYVPLPLTGGVALVPQTGEATRIDIGEGTITRLTSSPDAKTIIAILERYTCDEDDPRLARNIEVPEDCDAEDLVVHTELNVISGGKISSEIEVQSQFNTVEFSDDGRFAIAYLDFSQGDITLSGVVDLTSVMVLDVLDGTSTPVTVGFSANQVLFTYDENDQAERAVVLSENSVAVVDLFEETPTLDVTFPLTLDPDSTVVPVGIELTPDGQYALISVENRSDLYALDLENHSIRIVELSSNPSDMAVVDSTDTTVFVFGNGSAVDVLEHTLFDIETYDLDEPMTDITKGEDFALLYSTNGYHDCYFLDLVKGDLVEYRLQNPAVSLHLAPTEDFAIALTRPESGYGGDAIDARPGMEIIDLINEKNSTFVLEGQGVGVAYSSTETSLHALLLQQDTEYVYKYNLYTGEQQNIELSAPPISIGSMPDGNFYITHDNGSGLVSFLNPDSGSITEVAGFGTLGIIDPVELFEEEE